MDLDVYYNQMLGLDLENLNLIVEIYFSQVVYLKMMKQLHSPKSISWRMVKLFIIVATVILQLELVHLNLIVMNQQEHLQLVLPITFVL